MLNVESVQNRPAFYGSITDRHLFREVSDRHSFREVFPVEGRSTRERVR